MGQSREFQTTGRSLAPLQAFGPLNTESPRHAPVVSQFFQSCYCFPYAERSFVARLHQRCRLRR
jgi:hypothetical protein